MAIKIYLFDLDDTIIDTKIYAKIYTPILNMIQKKLDLNNKQLDEKAKELNLEKNKFSRWDTGELCKELNLLEEYYKILEKQIKVMPVLHKTILNVFREIKKQNKKIGIVSNSMTRTIKAYLNRYKLNDYIDFIFSIDDSGCKKRDEKYWKTLIEKKKLNPEECLVIGDDIIQDVKTPERVGFNTFLIKKPSDLKK